VFTREVVMATLKIISLLLLALIMISGCNKETEPVITYSIEGSIDFFNADGAVSDSINLASIKLFNPEGFFSDIVNVQQNYPFVGASIDPMLYLDHRLLGEPIAQTDTDENGFYILDNLDAGKYLLVYQADGFGWHKSIVETSRSAIFDFDMVASITAPYVINDDAVWGPNQHIIISNDVIIYPDFNLTIYENTTIEIVNSKLTTMGELLIQGNEINPVIVTSGNQNPSQGDWERIYIEENSNNSIFQYCIIQWADYGIENKGYFATENIAIINSLAYGIIFDQASSSIIDKLTIQNCLQGIYFFWTVSSETQPHIKNSMIINNSEEAIILYESSPTIENSVFLNNKYHISAEFNSYPKLKHCQFINAENYAILSQKEYNYEDYLYIFKCDFDETSIMRCARAAPVLANNNNFVIGTGLVFKLEYLFGSNDVDATNNWWDTVIESEIQEMIFDQTDPNAPNVGIVNYSDWKYSAVNDAGPQPE